MREALQRWLTFSSTERAFTPRRSRTRFSRYLPQPRHLLNPICGRKCRYPQRNHTRRLKVPSASWIPSETQTTTQQSFSRAFSISFRKSSVLKLLFRKVYVTGIIALIFTGKDTGSGKPSGVPSHDLHDGDGFLLIHRSVKNNLPHSGSYIFGGASVAGVWSVFTRSLSMVLGSPMTRIGLFDLRGIAGKLAHGIHRIIAADIEKPTDIQLLKLLKRRG